MALVFLAILAGGVAVFAAIGLFLWFTSENQKARRIVKGARRRRIAEIADGETVRVVGRVEVDEPVAAPLSGRPCAYWRVVVEEELQAGSGHVWSTVIDEHAGVDFFLREGDDRALVKTDRVRALLDQDSNYATGLLAEPTPAVEAFLVERGRPVRNTGTMPSLRCYEGALEPDERVAVVGVARWQSDSEAKPTAGDGYRNTQAAQRLVLDVPDEHELYITDKRKLTR